MYVSMKYKLFIIVCNVNGLPILKRTFVVIWLQVPLWYKSNVILCHNAVI